MWRYVFCGILYGYVDAGQSRLGRTSGLRGSEVGGSRVGSAGNYFTEICSGSETSSYLRLIDFVHHSTLGLRVIKKKASGLKEGKVGGSRVGSEGHPLLVVPRQRDEHSRRVLRTHFGVQHTLPA